MEKDMKETIIPNTPPPIDSSDMNVHLSYMRRDLDDVKNLIKVEKHERNEQHNQIVLKLDEIKDSAPTRAELNEYKVYIEKEKTTILKESDVIHLSLQTRILALEKLLSNYPLLGKVVFGGIGVILLSVLSAVLFIVIKN